MAEPVVDSVHTLCGAYVLDALDDAERATFEGHLPGCDDCREQIRSLQPAAALLAEIAAVPAPVSLRESLLNDIASVRPLPPLAPADASPASPAHAATAAHSSPDGPSDLAARRRAREDKRSHRRGRLAGLVAAAVVLLMAGVGAVWQPWQSEQAVPIATTSLDRVLTAKDAEQVSVPVAGGGRATVVRSMSHGGAVMVVQGLPTPPEGYNYQAWLQTASGEMDPAGVVPVKTGKQQMLLSGDVTEAIGVGITVEPLGGSPEPTSDTIALASLQKGGV